MSMLVHRQESQVRHAYFSSEVGLVDWISRNYQRTNEIQVASAFQNYGLLLLLSTNYPIELLPAQQVDQYMEHKESLPDGRIHHTISGSYELMSTTETTINIDEIFLESMRSIRVFQEAGREAYNQNLLHSVRPIITSYKTSEQGITFHIERNVLDAFEYRLDVFIESAHNMDSEHVFSISEGSHVVLLTIQLTGRLFDEDYAPLTSNPLELLKPNVRNQLSSMSPFFREMTSNQLEGLSLLSRKGKLFAGGPRFFTYFGRDTLISIAMLTGSVSADLVLYAFRSVFERLSLRGEVAHEETVGEYAAFLREHKAAHTLHTHVGSDVPHPSNGLLEYHMVDDDFLFPAVLAHWNEVEGTKKTELLLGESFNATGGEIKSGYELLGRTISYCFNRIQEGLVSYHTSVDVGDWRDSLSKQGIRYSYEVNIGLGLNFIDVVRTLAKQLIHLKPFLPLQIFKEEGDSFAASFKEETTRFTVRVASDEIQERVSSWLEHAGFSSDELSVLHQRLAMTPVNPEGYSFTAFGLDAKKHPIEVQHNDVAFTLLFGKPCLEDLDELLTPLETPFPLGLKTDVGILVSNSVFASQKNIAKGLDRSHYHGLVIWPLMNSLLFHGIQHQMKRLKEQRSPSDATKIIEYQLRFEKIKEYLISLHEKLKDFNSSELWTFSPTESGDIPLAFGKETGSSTESNPLQLWSCLGFTTLFDEN